MSFYNSGKKTLAHVNEIPDDPSLAQAAATAPEVIRSGCRRATRGMDSFGREAVHRAYEVIVQLRRKPIDS